MPSFFGLESIPALSDWIAFLQKEVDSVVNHSSVFASTNSKADVTIPVLVS